MAGGSVTIRKDVSGTLVVDITSAAGGTPTFYSDAALTTSVSFPDSITTSKTYYIGVNDQYVLSVLRDGVEIANSPDGTRSFRLEDTHLSVSPGPDASDAESGTGGASLSANNAFTGNNTFTVASGVPVTITNTGSGNSLVVEDSASTDSTPVVIDATGKVGVGTASPTANLHVKADWISNEGQISADVPSGGTYSGITMQNDGTIKGLAIWDNSGSQLLLSVPATTGKVVLGYNSTSPQISADMSTGATSIYGSGTERFKIDSAGLITGTGTSLGAWTAYTPTLAGTGTSLGNGTWTAYYCQIGKTVHFRTRLVLGTTTVIGTSVNITIPVACITGTNGGLAMQAKLVDTSAGQFYTAATSIVSTSVMAINTIGTAGLNEAVTSTTPFTWASTDEIHFAGTYEIA